MTGQPPLVAGIELGGTKCIAVAARGRAIVERLHIPTGAPPETLGALADAVAGWEKARGPVAALGIASFGPVALDPARPGYGTILTTPKPGWAGADVRGPFARRFAAPIALDTDVGGAALAEARWGAAAGCEVAVYLTVGTGIGGGVTVRGRPVHGLLHPEIGHIRVRRAAGDTFAGSCPFHGDCVEGLASGSAIAARAGGRRLAAGDPIWAYVADALAELVATLLLTLSAERILIGGGVALGQPALLPMIRARAAVLLAGFLPPVDEAALEAIVRPPALGADAGPLGAVALGLMALESGG